MSFDSRSKIKHHELEDGEMQADVKEKKKKKKKSKKVVNSEDEDEDEEWK